MIYITVDHNTNSEELDLLGNLLLDLARSREVEFMQPEVTQAPKKTKAKPVKLTSVEAGAPLTESPTTTADAALAASSEAEQAETPPATQEMSPGKPEPVQEPEPAPAEETSKPLDLVAMRAELAPIMKDKKDELVALIKEYGDSLPKIDPAQYPEILEKAKAL